MAILRSIGALAFVLGVALLALDGAQSMKIRRFDATSVEKFWTNLGGDQLFQLRYHLTQWIGSAADQILELPAAFVAFGLGLALLLIADGGSREERHQRPIAL
jgi:hypothetical protein